MRVGEWWSRGVVKDDDSAASYHSPLLSTVAIGRRMVSGCQFGSLVAPSRLLVDGVIGPAAQGPNQAAVNSDGRRRERGARRLVHERHELVGKAGHGAGDADAADVRAATDAGHPAALSDIAVHHGSPAAELDQAFRRTVF